MWSMLVVWTPWTAKHNDQLWSYVIAYIDLEPGGPVLINGSTESDIALSFISTDLTYETFLPQLCGVVNLNSTWNRPSYVANVIKNGVTLLLIKIVYQGCGIFC